MKPPSPILEQSFFFDTAKQNIWKILCEFPRTKFSLSDLAKKAHVSKSNISKDIIFFEHAGLAKVERLKSVWQISANLADYRFQKTKTITNLLLIYQTQLIDFLVEKYRHPKSIVLFGSYKKGEDVEGSDIDLAVERDDFSEYSTKSYPELSGLEKLLGRKISIHEFSRKKADRNLFCNIANGNVLYGFLEV